MKIPAYKPDHPRNAIDLLRKSHQLNRIILENVHECIAIHRLADLSYAFVNPAAAELSGYSQEELLGRSVLELIHPEDVANVLSTIRQKMPIGKGRLEFRFLKKDGSYIWLEVTGSLLPQDSGADAMIIVSGDIAERKESETALQKSHDAQALKLQEQEALINQLQEQLYAKTTELSRTKHTLRKKENFYLTLFENAGTASMIVNKNLQIIAGNHKLVQLTGYSRGELIGTNPFEKLLSPDYWPVVRENYRLNRLEPWQEPQEFAVEGRHKQGHIRKLLVNIAHVSDSNHQVVSIRDITEQHEAESQLRAGEERFRTLFEKAPVGITINRNGRTLVANQAYANLHGYDSGSQLVGTTVSKQVAPACRRTLTKLVKKAGKGDIVVHAHETVALRQDGSTFPALVRVNRILLSDGLANVTFIADLTQQKHAEAALQRQLDAQHLLLEISRRTNSSADDADDMINSTLQMMGENDQSDRSYIFIISEDGSTFSNTHEWCAEGIAPEITRLQNISVAIFPWWMSKLRGFETIHVPRVEDLPAGALAEKEILRAQSIQSVLVVPLIHEAKLIGFLGFDSVNKEKIWPQENISILGLVAENLAIALMRKKTAQALQQSESYYRTIFENTGGATLIIEEDMTICEANREWENSFGYRNEELVGYPWMKLFAKEAILEQMMENHHLRTTNPASAPPTYLSRLKDSVGNNRVGAIHLAMIPGTSRSLATFIDFTEFNRIDRALKAITAVNSIMIQAENEQDLLRNICQKIVEVGGYSMAWVGYVGEAPMQEVWPVAYAGNNNGYLTKVRISLQDPKRGRGPNATAIRTGKPVVTRDLSQDDTVFWIKEALRRGFKSIMAIPLMADNSAFGTLSIYANETDAFDDEEQKLLHDMANNLAYAILSLRTRSEKRQTSQELEISLQKMHRILMQSVTSLGTILDIRDPYTSGHQRKVARIAVAIAAAMGLDEDCIEGISVAGNLHDIGKISVPTEILSKPGKITDMEFGIIKTHSQAGYEIVKDIEFPWPVADIILQHHERMNGSGYPRGIKAADIIMEARIMAVADVVEAMASHRPYRPALGIDIALGEITQNKGILYDPQVVDTCLKLFYVDGFEFE